MEIRTNFLKSSLHFWTKFDDIFHQSYGEKMEIVLTHTLPLELSL